MGTRPLTEPMNALLEAMLERHAHEVRDLLKMFARELGVPNTPSKLAEVLRAREFKEPEPKGK